MNRLSPRQEPAVGTRGLAILGSTGSIGTQTLEVVDHLADRFRVVALAASTNTALLNDQAERYRPRLVVSAAGTKSALNLPPETVQMEGSAGLVAASTHPDVDIVVVASSGHSAIEATIEAIKLGRTIALANKETLVCAASLILPLARQHRASIHPVDSEHSAIWQSLDRGDSEIERLILTASGGPFLHTPLDHMRTATVEQALGHPTWSMGSKITIDSATMMNKGLELIEAHCLFDVPYERIDVVIHPESILHSMVEYRDCSQIAQASLPDMRLPIQFALTYPHHVESPCKKLDLAAVGKLTFLPVEAERFPALQLARDAGTRGASYPTVLSAADEVAVIAFLEGRIQFGDIVPIVAATIGDHDSVPIDTLEALLESDGWARQRASHHVASARA
ncbi:MAG: 1-deoxy-D-xylulose-5-phosphate reductoisomerase [Thermomicrobiales bacterium]